jgi:hypothetical protein
MPKDFWKKKWGKSAICAITHTRLRPGKNKHGMPYSISLSCKHRFVRSALLEWVKQSVQTPVCPLCRNEIKLVDLTFYKN